MIKFIFRTIVDDVASFGGMLTGTVLSLLMIFPIHYYLVYFYPEMDIDKIKELTSMLEVGFIIAYGIFTYICYIISRWFKIQDRIYVHEVEKIKKRIEED